MAGGSASALSLSRPAQASLTLRPAGSLSRPRRPLSRGSDPASYPAEPLVSFRTYRQLSGWNPPPLVIRAFGAHCQFPDSCSAASAILIAHSHHSAGNWHSGHRPNARETTKSPPLRRWPLEPSSVTTWTCQRWLSVLRRRDYCACIVGGSTSTLAATSFAPRDGSRRSIRTTKALP